VSYLESTSFSSGDLLKVGVEPTTELILPLHKLNNNIIVYSTSETEHFVFSKLLKYENIEKH